MVRTLQSPLALALMVALVSHPLAAQTGTSDSAASTAQPAIPNGPTPSTNLASTGPPPGEGIMTIKARTNIVVIDVVVTDAKQNPVHGLKISDFTLSENNTPQRIRNFEEHVTLPASETAKMPPPPKLPPGLFTNVTRAPQNGPVNVILLDTLNTPTVDQPYVRQQLLDYLNKAQPGTRIAIFALTTSLNMLQGFTSDTTLLKTALMNKGNPRPSDLLTDPTAGVGGNQDTSLSNLFASQQDGTDLTGAQALANVQRFQALQTSFELGLRVKFTLGAFNLLAKYLVGIPGRKNVIWFSGSFPLNIAPDPALQDPNDSVVTSDEELRKTDNLLTKSQIAVYPVDARGLIAAPAMDISTNTQTDMVQFFHDTSNDHETMLTMAEDTGGHAFLNTNGLAEAVAKAVENGSNYYTLTYTPSDARYDARFRTVRVKLNAPQKGVNLVYRRGYYAIDPYDKNKLVAETAATNTTRASTMSTAMMRGGPDPTEILFKVRIRPAAAPPDETPIRNNKVNPDPKLAVKGPYQQYGIDLAPDPKAVNCPTSADGNHHCAIEVATFVYDGDGGLAVTTSATARFTLSPTLYARMLHDGMPFHQQVSVPVRGQYFLRTAVHDLMSDRVGAVEVPVAAVAKLAPLSVAPPVPVVPAVPSSTPQDNPDPAGLMSLPDATPVAPPVSAPQVPAPAAAPSPTF